MARRKRANDFPAIADVVALTINLAKFSPSFENFDLFIYYPACFHT
jgi:hypothetical protein